MQNPTFEHPEMVGYFSNWEKCEDKKFFALPATLGMVGREGLFGTKGTFYITRVYNNSTH